MNSPRRLMLLKGDVQLEILKNIECHNFSTITVMYIKVYILEWKWVREFMFISNFTKNKIFEKKKMAKKSLFCKKGKKKRKRKKKKRKYWTAYSYKCCNCLKIRLRQKSRRGFLIFWLGIAFENFTKKCKKKKKKKKKKIVIIKVFKNRLFKFLTFYLLPPCSHYLQLSSWTKTWIALLQWIEECATPCHREADRIRLPIIKTFASFAKVPSLFYSSSTAQSAMCQCVAETVNVCYRDLQVSS